MARPTGVIGRPQLKQEDLIRIQTLSRDAKMGPSEIRGVTGYSIHQIKYALKKKTPTVGIRTGRPRKGESPKKKGDGEQAGQGQAGEAAERSMVAEGEHDQQAVPGEPAPLTAGHALQVELAAQHNQPVTVGQPQDETQLGEHLEARGEN